MSFFQIRVVGILALLNMLEGFDILVISFTASTISDEWGLSSTSVGILFSSGLAGMAIGSVFLAPLADKFGRRAVILSSLFIVTIGMLLAGLTNTFVQLAIVRFLTGLGVGGALASINVMVAEYSSDKYRGMAISLVQIAYPVGAMLGGAVAALIIVQYGWREVFFVGAGLSIVMIPVVIYFMPESVDYLLVKQPKNALQRVNYLLKRMGHAEVSELVQPVASSGSENNIKESIWSDKYRRTTLLLWLTFFMTMFSLYFVMNWIPKLLVSTGGSTREGISGGLILQIGGITGQLLLGYLASKLKLSKIISFYAFASAIALALFGLYSNELSIAMYVGALVGFFLFGTITGLYALTPMLYEPTLRSTGMGWAIGIGRTGAIISPLLTGVLLDMGWAISTVFFLFAIPVIVAMVSVQLVSKE